MGPRSVSPTTHCLWQRPSALGWQVSSAAHAPGSCPAQVTRQAHYTQHFVTVHAVSLLAAAAQLADAAGGQAPPLGQLLRLVEDQSVRTCDASAGELVVSWSNAVYQHCGLLGGAFSESNMYSSEGSRSLKEAEAVFVLPMGMLTIAPMDRPLQCADFRWPPCSCRRLRRPRQAAAAA